jgi:hypothetical protein
METGFNSIFFIPDTAWNPNTVKPWTFISTIYILQQCIELHNAHTGSTIVSQWMRSRMCSWQKQYFPGTGMVFKMSMHMHGRKPAAECPNNAPSACTDRKKHGSKERHSILWCLCQTRGLYLRMASKIERYKLHKITLDVLSSLKLELPYGVLILCILQYSRNSN